MEAVIGAVYLDAGWPAARDLVLRPARRPHRPRPPTGPGGHDYKTRLQELAARDVRAAAASTTLRDEGPDHAKRFFAVVRVGGERPGRRARAARRSRPSRPPPGPRGPVAAELAGTNRADRLARRTRPTRSPNRPAVAGRAERASRRCLSCPRSRRSAATSNGGRRASGSRRSRSPAPRSMRRHDEEGSSSARLEGAKITAVDRKGKYLLVRARHRRRARRSTCGMSGQLLRAAAKDAAAQAHPRRHHLHPGRPAALRRPPHVRRDVRDRRPTQLDRRGPRAGRPRLRPGRASRCRGRRSASCCMARKTEAQGAA